MEARQLTGVEIAFAREDDYTVATVQMYPLVKKVKVLRSASTELMFSEIKAAVLELYLCKDVQF